MEDVDTAEAREILSLGAAADNVAPNFVHDVDDDVDDDEEDEGREGGEAEDEEDGGDDDEESEGDSAGEGGVGVDGEDEVDARSVAGHRRKRVFEAAGDETMAQPDEPDDADEGAFDDYVIELPSDVSGPPAADAVVLITRLDSDQPLLRIGARSFVGQHQRTIGTSVAFELLPSSARLQGQQAGALGPSGPQQVPAESKPSPSSSSSPPGAGAGAAAPGHPARGSEVRLHGFVCRKIVFKELPPGATGVAPGGSLPIWPGWAGSFFNSGGGSAVESIGARPTAAGGRDEGGGGEGVLSPRGRGGAARSRGGRGQGGGRGRGTRGGRGGGGGARAARGGGSGGAGRGGRGRGRGRGSA